MINFKIIVMEFPILIVRISINTRKLVAITHGYAAHLMTAAVVSKGFDGKLAASASKSYFSSGCVLFTVRVTRRGRKPEMITQVFNNNPNNARFSSGYSKVNRWSEKLSL